jgi:hypothetical protein
MFIRKRNSSAYSKTRRSNSCKSSGSYLDRTELGSLGGEFGRDSFLDIDGKVANSQKPLKEVKKLYYE